MTKEKDIVEDIFSRVRSILGDEFKDQIIIKLEQEEIKIRHDWGGTEPYIAKKRDREKRKQEVKEELNRGSTIKEVTRKTGICRTVIYDMLKRR